MEYKPWKISKPLFFFKGNIPPPGSIFVTSRNTLSGLYENINVRPNFRKASIINKCIKPTTEPIYGYHKSINNIEYSSFMISKKSKKNSIVRLKSLWKE